MFRTDLPSRQPRVSRMRATLRSDREVAAIAAAGAGVAEALEEARLAAAPGVATGEIESIVAAVFERRGADAVLRDSAAMIGGRRFPGACCTSVNEVALHGVPGERVLRDGDLLSVDAACRFEGWCADAAITIPVGRVDGARRRLIETVEQALEDAIAEIRPGRRWSEIATSIQTAAESAGFATVTGWTGHGIGQQLHEWPPAPATLTEALLVSEDFTLLPGMVLAIEPVFVLQSPSPSSQGCARGVAVRIGEDGWSVETLSGSPACHVEHTVAITRRGGEVLTRRQVRVASTAVAFSAASMEGSVA
ncbi:MAG: type I methionyl aminopeptidase [Phycisphaerales bacterium]